MININYRDARPIYEQVREGLKKLIVTGALADGEKLPSVRALASKLSINPNTIQRAYSELEAEGYCVSIPGKGSFAVAEAKEPPAAPSSREVLEADFRRTLAALLELGATRREIEALCQAAYDERRSALEAEFRKTVAQLQELDVSPREIDSICKVETQP